jgi:hypothetical protein
MGTGSISMPSWIGWKQICKCLLTRRRAHEQL